MNMYGIGQGTPRTLDVVLLEPELHEAVMRAMHGDDILFSLPGEQGTLVNNLGDNMRRALERYISDIPEHLRESMGRIAKSSRYAGIQIVKSWEE